MKRSSLLTACLCLLTGLLLSPSSAKAQAQDKDPKEAPLILKVYRVADLFTPRPDYPYRPGLPTTESLEGTTNSQSSSPKLGGGSFGGAQQGGGGGFFQVPDPIPQVAQFGGDETGMGLGGAGMMSGRMGGGSAPEPASDDTLRFSRDELIQAITSTVLPESWADNGGPGVCSALGGTLLIRQTAAIHLEIATLLEDLRTQGGQWQTVTVEASWVSLTTGDLAKLTASQQPTRDGLIPLDAAALKEVTAKNPSFHGRLSCYNDQTVHLVSGNRRTVLVGGIPTVGFYSSAYTPVVAHPNVGVLFQVRPSVDQDQKTAVLNLISTVTEWQEPGEPITIKSEIGGGQHQGLDFPKGIDIPKGIDVPRTTTQLTIDRVNLRTQHLGTTVRVPLGQPVLVGGLSSAGADQKQPQGEAVRSLSLIVKITVNDQPQPAEKP